MAGRVQDATGYFSTVAEGFHASYARDANRQERLDVWRRFLDRYLGDAGSAYDLGCGSGILACELARRGVRTVGLDGAPGMLAIARQEAARAGLDRVTFAEQVLPVTNPADWPPADAVIASSALEYLPSLPGALHSVHALLRPGGLFILSMSNRDSLSRLAVRAVHAVTGYPDYVGLLRQFCTQGGLRRDLGRAGFRPLAAEYFARADRVNRALGAVLPARLASNMIIMAAQRV